MSEPYTLLVEDDPSDEELTKRVLGKIAVAHPIVVTRDGAEALDFLFAKGEYEGRSVGDLPRVILLDLNLPRIGGLEVLRRIRADERTRLVPVVILTSSGQQSDQLEGYARGGNSYVVKPVDFEAFSDAIRQLGLFWIGVNCPPTGDVLRRDPTATPRPSRTP